MDETQLILRDAVRYWEIRRMVYNIVLAIVVIGWLVFTWPHFRPAMTMQSLRALFILAAIANVCYSTAYIAEFAVQLSSVRAAWRRGRWMLWLVGTLFAVLLEYYWIADEIYPYAG